MERCAGLGIGGVVLGALNFVAVPFIVGMSYGFCSRTLLPHCSELATMLPPLPVGLLLGLIQWLLGRRLARRTPRSRLRSPGSWRSPCEAAAVGERAPIGELLPASVLATLAYALVVALALPGLRPRPR